MDLIDQGIITENLFKPSIELLEMFNSYWISFMPPGSRTSMAYPFPRLKKRWFLAKIVHDFFALFTSLAILSFLPFTEAIPLTTIWPSIPVEMISRSPESNFFSKFPSLYVTFSTCSRKTEKNLLRIMPLSFTSR